MKVDNGNDSMLQPVRVWMDGCFDMVHAGHANALRQFVLADITTNKGRPLTTEVERRRMISSIRWVDEVVEDIPFGTSTDLLDKHKCDFCVHGDEFATNGDGKDSYGEVKAAQRYIKCNRLDGISTTDIVERILQATTQVPNTHTTAYWKKAGSTGVSSFLTSTCLIHEFSEGNAPQPGDKVVYVDGAFDLFHAGHIDFLEKAAAEGDFLIVGLHPDTTVSSCGGSGNPVMNLHERTLSVLACKYVSDVIMGAPFVVTSELMKHFQVDVVCHGMTPTETGPNGEDPYREPKRLGKFRVIDSGSELTTKMIIERTVQNRLEFEERNTRKEAKERRIATHTQGLNSTFSQ
ncbi:ethanolamine-phosphate cytidylyltransferase-like [Haliotis rubra]|uniref:ethanolamine-phosphate cytidylyltransferase-like n=1 Tax=Haliotis rubra TaxID=36100 RepID=UPI001EE5F212|nr:ethanolamine-phosphate cytidylyltransferase-like [Haliotis rubra]